MPCTDCYSVNSTPCGTTGCLETHNSNCIIYNGGDLYCDPDLAAVITDGVTLNEIISNLNERICEISVAGTLDWTTFDYQCLRLDGSLTSAGASDIATARGFAEAASIALCDLNTRVSDVETPTITPSCTSLVSGTSTLSEILDELISRACSVETILDLSSVTNSCFSAVPSSVNLDDWISWIITNVCEFDTILTAADAGLDSRVTVIEGRLNDFDNATYTCIPGAADNQSLETTLTNIMTQMCVMDASVDALVAGTSNLTLTYSSCVTGTATQGLVAHLDNIISQINSYTFGAGIVDTPSGCSHTITLDPAYVFSCSDLASCSLGDLGNVDLTGVTTYDLLGFDSSDWVPFSLDVVSADGSVTVTRTNSPTGISFDLSVPDISPSNITFTPAVSGITIDSYLVTALQSEHIAVTNETVVMDLPLNLTNITWNSQGWLTVGSVNSPGIPSSARFVQCQVIENFGTPSFNNFSTVARINTSGNIEIYNWKSSTYTITSPDLLIVIISGQSYQL